MQSPAPLFWWQPCQNSWTGVLLTENVSECACGFPDIRGGFFGITLPPIKSSSSYRVSPTHYAFCAVVPRHSAGLDCGRNRRPLGGWFRSHGLGRILSRRGSHPIGSRGGGIPLQVRAALLSPCGRDYLGCRIPSLPAGHLRHCLAISGNGRPRDGLDSGDWMHRPTGDCIRYACGGRHDDRAGAGVRLLLRHGGCHGRRRNPTC